MQGLGSDNEDKSFDEENINQFHHFQVRLKTLVWHVFCDLAVRMVQTRLFKSGSNQTTKPSELFTERPEQHVLPLSKRKTLLNVSVFLEFEKFV